MSTQLPLHMLPADQLNPYLDRHRKSQQTQTAEVFLQTMEKVVTELQEFVPCKGIYLLMDDPVQSYANVKPRNLTYMAAMGHRSDLLVGQKTISNQGIIAKTYNVQTMQMVRTDDSISQGVLDKVHLPDPIDNAVCAPLTVGSSTMGVFCMVNKNDPTGFTMRDIRMLLILSSYLTMSLQNAIDTKKIQEQTKRDDLTGLYNDRYFHQRLAYEIEQAKEKNHPLSLMFLDLDHFKSINDQHGHLVGSQTLKEVGFVIRESVQTEGAILARYGGDEYVAILPHVPLSQAYDIADGLRQNICDKMFMVSDPSQNGALVSFKGVLSASIGVASLHDHVPPAEDVLHQKNLFLQLTDKAMYDAKAKGKNQVSVAQSMIDV
jgi:diguanylate cyclase (GGDEF)-like protein